MFPKENMSGDGQELPRSDLLNNRHVIQFAKLLVSRRESPRKNEKVYNSEIVNQVSAAILAKWKEATFPPDKLIAEKSVTNKVESQRNQLFVD